MRECLKAQQRIWALLKAQKKQSFFHQVHDSLIRTAYNMFKDQPIFGHGPKMFRVICAR